jgi:predicted metalloprotease
MRLDDQRESSNIENQRGRVGMGVPGRGMGLPIGGRSGGLGCGGLVLLVIIASVLGINPMALIGLGGGDAPVPIPPQAQLDPGAPAARGPAIQTETDRFVAKVLATTEDTWTRIFAANGQRYIAPKLVLYDGIGQSGCGVAQSAAGPFYCPADRKIYLDTSFFNEMARRFGAPGDFAAAYVIAHEVGHHIQLLTGVAEQVQRAQQRASRAQANALQVRMELQADCYAGVWGHDNRQLLEPGDVEEALAAASAIGDDTLMKQAGRRPVPESFTHGTSKQRMRWFMRGYQSGDPGQCDTFGATEL